MRIWPQGRAFALIFRISRPKIVQNWDECHSKTLVNAPSDRLFRPWSVNPPQIEWAEPSQELRIIFGVKCRWERALRVVQNGPDGLSRGPSNKLEFARQVGVFDPV